MHHKVVIVGSGPAGYTAAVYAARAMLEPLVITGSEPGGQLTTTTDVENYPGFAEAIQGPWLMEQMRAQAEHVGAAFVTDHVTSVDLSRRPFHLHGDRGNSYTCDVLVIATGAQAKWMGLPGEQRFRGFGVSACATCDGFFFRGKEIVVIGGGDTAMEEATYLTKFASKVTVIHRRDELRASRIMQDRAMANEKIEFLWDSVVEEILGGRDEGVHAVRVRNVKTDAVHELACQGVFVAIGHKPNTELFTEWLELDPVGYIKVRHPSTWTNVEGVFASGDAIDPSYRQAVTAAGTGCQAAIDAERWLETLD
jgi:thioredoxin reductase (NADPH)